MTHETRGWTRIVADAVEACGEVMFPANDAGIPDWREARVTDRTLAYLVELPPPTRRLVMLLFVVIELCAPLLLAGLGRFSRLSRQRRERAMTRWRDSGFPPYRLLMDALKAQLCMMYLSHAAVQRHMRVWKTCERPGDELALPTRADVFDGDAPNGLREGRS